MEIETDLNLVMVPVTMPPGPIFLLFVGGQLAEVSVLVTVILASPLAIVNDFVVVPDVVIAVIGVIDSVMVGARSAHYRKNQRSC